MVANGVYKKMNNIPSEIIIIGGGSSINEGISLGLKDRIKDKFVVLCNFAFYHFDGTFLTFIDHEFYSGFLKSNTNPPVMIQNKEHREKIIQFPLIIGHETNQTKTLKVPNTILLKSASTYTRDLSKGIYNSHLVGIFSLTLACWLMDFKGKIFLCGYDYSHRTPEQIQNKEKAKTHYYSEKELNHRGIGYTNFYEKHKSSNYFSCYLQEKNIKIYNVSLNSNIGEFEKINYPTMFDLLDDVRYDQEELRELIKNKIIRALL